MKVEQFLQSAEGFLFISIEPTYNLHFLNIEPPLREAYIARAFNCQHALELYLKATSFQIHGRYKFGTGHDIKLLWDKCKKDSNFLPKYEIKPIILNKLIELKGMGFENFLSNKDLEHYCHNTMLYRFCLHEKGDLKYFGIDSNYKHDYIVWGDDLCYYWICFFNNLNKYLNYSWNDSRLTKMLTVLPEWTKKYD
jgi:hypothetical protein